MHYVLSATKLVCVCSCATDWDEWKNWFFLPRGQIWRLRLIRRFFYHYKVWQVACGFNPRQASQHSRWHCCVKLHIMHAYVYKGLSSRLQYSMLDNIWYVQLLYIPLLPSLNYVCCVGMVGLDHGKCESYAVPDNPTATMFIAGKQAHSPAK